MSGLYQKFLCCGGKARSRSVRPDEIQKNLPLYPCEICQQRFPTLISLGNHQLNCSPKNPTRNPVRVPPGMTSQRTTPNVGKTEESFLRDTKNVSYAASRLNTAEKTGRNGENSNTDKYHSDSLLSDRSVKQSGASARKLPPMLVGPSVDAQVEKAIKDLENKPLRTKREMELKFITQNIDKKTFARYLISEKWIEYYTAYLNGENKTPPEPINNEELKQMVIKKTLPKNIYLVNEIIWKFVQRLYEGGPEIKQCNKSISFMNHDGSCDQSIDTQTADTFSHTESSTRNSFYDTQKSAWQPSTPYLKPIGLSNTLFYCYMNSCLQMLLGITDLAQYISHEKYKALIGKDGSKFWKAMTEIVHGHFRQFNCLTPISLQQLSLKCFDPDEQHDAHEFLRYLLSSMQDEVNLQMPKKDIEFNNPDNAWVHYKKYHISLIDDLLAGQLISTVACSNCKHVSRTYDPFLDLSLPIIPEKTKNLDDCLTAFQKEEEIDDCYKCEKCKTKTKAIKKLNIHRCPKYLVINLKRFQTYPKKRKLKDQINYPVYNWKIKDGSSGEIENYALVGVVVHYGPIDSGHYVCYSKRGSEWLLCDDENISRVDEGEVASKEAYVLMYERGSQIEVPRF